jgi:hypothetical protein
MRFNSPDRESPFDQGGINSHMYCGGNPVDFLDSTGRFRFIHWLGKRLGFASGTSNSAKNTQTHMANSGKGNVQSAQPVLERKSHSSSVQENAGQSHAMSDFDDKFKFELDLLKKGDVFNPRSSNYVDRFIEADFSKQQAATVEHSITMGSHFDPRSRVNAMKLKDQQENERHTFFSEKLNRKNKSKTVIKAAMLRRNK